MSWLLTAIILLQSDAPPVDPAADPAYYVDPVSPFVLLFAWLMTCGSWLYLPFLIWMAIYCARNDPERYVWLWIIILVPFGPFIYLLARWLPNQNLRAPGFLQRWTRGPEIQRLRVAARQIGNAHQFVELGDALRETGRNSEAADAYGRAIEKDPQNLQALWGGACIDVRQHRYTEAKAKLEQVIDADPAYKFGDVSLLYGKTLHALGEAEAARDHLEKHTRRWRHPEGVYLLADLYANAGEHRQAREQLQALIEDLDGSPRAIARKHIFWKSRARRMLRRLPRA